MVEALVTYAHNGNVTICLVNDYTQRFTVWGYREDLNVGDIVHVTHIDGDKLATVSEKIRATMSDGSFDNHCQ